MYHNPRELDSVPNDKYEAIQQYEWWRPAGTLWQKIDKLETSHLENLKSWLLQNAADFYYKSKQHTGMHHPADWMRSQPLFISVTHEIQVRKNHERLQQMLYRHADPNKFYAFTPRKNSALQSARTDLVKVHEWRNGKVHLVDAISGRSLWQHIPLEDFVQNSVEVVFPQGNIKQHGTVTGKLGSAFDTGDYGEMF